ncbi:hypothetical protein [uncultured Eudoraea sp.]|uniref:hypothetical protein n=1 Tax=uncultured Eudoraea sp. TaxID=1035614 RepID=UPI002635DDFC|nr:hypothetical protein [uncultured Eudoraea sp.]
MHSKKKYDVIVTGDSRVYRGVAPASLSEELGGLEVLNFGFSSAGYNATMYHAINDKMSSGLSQKMVILGITPYSLTKKAQENSHYSQEKLRDQKDVFLRRYINPLLHFFDPIKPTDILYNTDSIPGYHEKFQKDGWVASYKTPSDPSAALEPYVKNFHNNLVKEKVLFELGDQVKKWTDQGVVVFAFRVPSSREMEKLENEISGFDTKQVIQVIENSGGMWLKLDNIYDYNSYDGSHLDEISAISFSKYLGSFIRGELKRNKE